MNTFAPHVFQNTGTFNYFSKTPNNFTLQCWNCNTFARLTDIICINYPLWRVSRKHLAKKEIYKIEPYCRKGQLVMYKYWHRTGRRNAKLGKHADFDDIKFFGVIESCFVIYTGIQGTGCHFFLPVLLLSWHLQWGAFDEKNFCYCSKNVKRNIIVFNLSALYKGANNYVIIVPFWMIYYAPQSTTINQSSYNSSPLACYYLLLFEHINTWTVLKFLLT